MLRSEKSRGGSVMRGRRSIAFCCVLFVLMALMGAVQSAWSQEVTAAIVGTVTDPSGAPIKGATVTATDTERGTAYQGQTNDTGAYNVNRIPVGTFTVKVSAPGFQTSVHPAFTLVLNQTARIDIQMKVGQVTETVEVSTAAPILKTESTQGGTVNTTIKSGTNGFHGDLWEYFRNDVLNANNWEHGFLGSDKQIPKNKLRWNMFGGTIGGPIVKNKLFFFFDYQAQRFDHPSTTNQISVFTAAERAGDFGDICPEGFTGGICNNPAHQLHDPFVSGNP